MLDYGYTQVSIHIFKPTHRQWRHFEFSFFIFFSNCPLEEMNVNIIIILLVVLTNILCNGQSSKGKKDQRRLKSTFKLKKVDKNIDVTARVQCLECSIEFIYAAFDPMNLCYNPAINFTTTKATMMTICPPDARFCQTEIVRLQGVFIGITRKCGVSSCLEACFHKGFGVDRQSCTYCCGGIQPHHFNEETGKVYNCP